ncbi:hypothetical protein QZH41_010224 [Actinostola sp. cb2023]|nr:hypothetical protein QZH41_010224 [Actinostola sp. cb2023]
MGNCQKRLAMQEISNCLLEGPEGHMLFSHNLKLVEENKYFLTGCLVGISIMQDGPGLGCFDPTFYQLCGLPCDLLDFNIEVIADREFVDTVKQLKSLDSEKDFQAFVVEKGDYVALQGYQSKYIAKLQQRPFIIQALLVEVAFGL